MSLLGDNQPLTGLGSGLSGSGGLFTTQNSGAGSLLSSSPGNTGLAPIESLVPEQKQAGLLGNTDRAVLYIFRPAQSRPLTDQAHRANLFHFDDRFCAQAAEAIESAIHRGTSARSVLALANGPDASKLLRPSTSPDAIVRTSTLSNNWQFMLCIYEKAGSSLASQRVVLTGYFIDEPINPLTLHSAKPTVNPQATLVFTHKTVVGMQRSADYTGTPQASYNTFLDVHCLNPQQQMPLTQSEMHLLDATTCINTLDGTAGGSSFSTPGATSGLSSLEGSTDINTTHDRSKHAVREVLTCVHQGHEQFQMESRMSSFSGAINFSTPRASGDTLLGIVKEQFTSRNTAMYGGDKSPKSRDSWHLNRLIRTYPGLRIEPLQPEGAYMFSAADQSTSNEYNTFSALLCAEVPAIMVDAGLGTLSFTATVKHKTKTLSSALMSSGAEDTNVFYSISLREAYMQIPESELNIRANAVMRELCSGVFENILMLRGEFTVSASFSLSGRSHVLLNFLGDTYQNTVPYEVPTSLSGLITPTLGVAQCHGHNAQEIQQFMGFVLGDSAVDNATRQIPLTQSGVLNGTNSAGGGLGLFSESGLLSGGLDAPLTGSPEMNGGSGLGLGGTGGGVNLLG